MFNLDRRTNFLPMNWKKLNDNIIMNFMSTKLKICGSFLWQHMVSTKWKKVN